MGRRHRRGVDQAVEPLALAEADVVEDADVVDAGGFHACEQRLQAHHPTGEVVGTQHHPGLETHRSTLLTGPGGPTAWTRESRAPPGAAIVVRGSSAWFRPRGRSRSE